MTISNPHAWHETTPGIWQRNVDEPERFYYAMARLYEGSGRMFFAITGHVSLRVAVPDGVSPDVAESRLNTALRKAWLALRYEHPTIASQVSQHTGTDEVSGVVKTYRSCQNDTEAASWLDETFVSVSNGQTGIEWANSDPPAPQLPTLFAIKVQNSNGSVEHPRIRRDLVLRSPHDVIDGIGTLLLLNNYIGHVTKFYDFAGIEPPHLDGSEVKNLSPPFRIAASVPETLSETQQKRLLEMAEQKAVASKNDGSVAVLSIPFKSGPLLPGKHQRAALSLCVEETAKIVKLSKSLGATVTHVFHAAIALAIRDLQQQQQVAESSRVRYVSYILRNDRTSCNAPYNSPCHAASVYHSVSAQALVVDMDAQHTRDSQKKCEEFLSAVRTVRDFYDDVRNDADHYAFVPAIFKAVTPPVPNSTDSNPPVPPPKDLPSVSISSMGKVDNIIPPSQGAIEVNDPWVTGEELGNGLGVFLGTYRGELCLSAAYNDAWHAKAEVMGFLGRCRDLVLEIVKTETA